MNFHTFKMRHRANKIKIIKVKRFQLVVGEIEETKRWEILERLFVLDLVDVRNNFKKFDRNMSKYSNDVIHLGFSFGDVIRLFNKKFLSLFLFKLLKAHLKSFVRNA